MNKIQIKSIYKKNSKIYVKPSYGQYEMIYRAAKGVYWDKTEKAFYMNDLIDEKDVILNIKVALKQEYGIELLE